MAAVVPYAIIAASAATVGHTLLSKPPKPPPVPQPPAAPETPDAAQTAERERQAAAAQRKRAMGARGRSDTILTGGSGLTMQPPTAFKTLLGR